MASISEKLNKLLADCAVMMEAVKRQGSIQSTDHDVLQTHKEQIKTLFKQFGEFKTNFDDFVKDLNKRLDQKKSRMFQVMLVIISAIIGPMVVVILLKLMGLISWGGAS